ncbi:hypothetical protein [Actinoplanes sp. NPDC049599]|uniref:hypothetical protein n=1 Tax=Actinoplanes sp. NPDC049599 TaxID=3363903 RepID=UPI0037A436D3
MNAQGQPALRTTAIWVVSVPVVPLLLLNAFMLLWFLPELTSWGTAGNEGHQYLWLLVFVLTGAAAVCLILAWLRRHRSARWWLWLLAAPLLITVSLPAMNGL